MKYTSKLASYTVALTMLAILSILLTGCCDDDPKGHVVYIDIDEATMGYNDPYHLDIDGDGKSEFAFDTNLMADDTGDHMQFKIFPRFSNGIVGADESVAVIPTGALIGPHSAHGKYNQVLAVKTISNNGESWHGEWYTAQNQYAGIRFKLKGTGYYYGWIRISIDTTIEKVIIHDMAYYSVTGGSIAAGKAW